MVRKAGAVYINEANKKARQFTLKVLDSAHPLFMLLLDYK